MFWKEESLMVTNSLGSAELKAYRKGWMLNFIVIELANISFSNFTSSKMKVLL